jgi:hypothetical protein
MSNGLTRFLGDTPLRTVMKLAVISFVVGVVMTALDLSVFDIFDGVREFFVRVWNMGFAAIERFAGYFLIIRLLKFRRS